MKPIKIFKIGSRAFFEQMPNFNPKDYDELCIMDRFPFNDTNALHAHLKGKDVIFYKNMNKDDYIKDCFSSPIKIGKLLIPEFAEYINLTINDLKNISSIVDKLDEKHEYEKIIYDAYISNNGFFLTEEQRNTAYQKYLEKRLNDGRINS